MPAAAKRPCHRQACYKLFRLRAQNGREDTVAAPGQTLKKQVLHRVGRPSFDHAVSHTKV
jgi:hypothetical protein